MYLNDSEECEVLLRLISDCGRLVDDGGLEPKAAFVIIREAAMHHSDYPETKQNRLDEFARKAEIAEPEPSIPVPDVPVPMEAETAAEPESMPF